MKIFLSVLFLSTAAFADITIRFEEGGTISGFNGKEIGTQNGQMSRTKKDGKLETLEANDKATVEVLTDGDRQNIFWKTGLLFQRRASVVLEKGEFLSQINCVNEPGAVNNCYVVNYHVCNALLQESGKKSFDDYLTEVKACENTMNAYQRAVNRKEVGDSIDRAYEDHNDMIKSKYPILSKLPAGGTYPVLTSRDGAKIKSDLRLYSLLATCSYYTNNGTFTAISKRAPVAPKKSNTPDKGDRTTF